jgi:uncharacterized repeat protein (TIGR04052 family)
MVHPARTALAVTAFTTLLGLTACGGGEAEAPQSVSIDFTAVAGATAVRCGSALAGLGRGGATAQLKDARFYVSNVMLVRADGVEVPLLLDANDDWNLSAGGDRVTLIDLEDGTGACSEGTAALNASIKGTVPAGRYLGVKATMGVPFALNHSDTVTAARPLDVQAMAWSWQSGRKFAKIELTEPDGAAGSWPAKTFNVHLGSTGCTGNPASGQTVSCKAPNRMAFALAAFDPATQKLAVDVAALLAGTDITVNLAGAAGCMSGGTDPECLHVFEAMAIDWKPDGTGTGLPIAGGAAQTLFRAVPK